MIASWEYVVLGMIVSTIWLSGLGEAFLNALGI